MADKSFYKETLFLPKTDFPMRANLSTREPNFLKFWQDIDVYQKLKEKRKDSKPFILHDGPPYANASIHIGTATNKILKDFVVKYKWQRGYFTPYVPGYDTHGLPIELKVLKDDGLSKDELTPTELRTRCAAYAKKHVKIQTEQFKRLGVIGDWEHPYLTLLPKYEATQLEGFAKMVEKGLVYKGLKPTYWCTDCQTALAAAEIEYKDATSHSIFVAYQYQDAEKISPEFAGKDVNVIIWTTTPWTLPASMAVSVHPANDYAFYEAKGKIYLIAKELKSQVEAATGLVFGEEIFVCKGRDLEGTNATHPFYDRVVPFCLADYVTLEDGTGCVHTAPGHGVEDYETGVRYGIEVYNPVDPTGHYYKETPIFAGMSLAEGEAKVFEILTANGRLLGESKISHSYPHCWRCKKPVIFRATSQWFVNVAKFKEEALKAIETVKWIPDWGQDRITNMVRDRSDWCISRQRTWGVPIPAFYCEDCGEVILTADRVRAVSEKIREKGSDIWWQMSPEELLGELAVCPHCGSRHLAKDKNIMDVWFDSGTSHTAVLNNWSDLSWPADLYLEGSDQHRGWFQTSLLNSVATQGSAPYKAVLTHGFIMGPDGQKMSKSLGNTMKPENIIDKWGADLLRLWVSSSDYRGDVRISIEIFNNLSELYRRIRNTARFLLANLAGFDPKKDIVSFDEMSELDKYIILKLEKLRAKVTAGLDEYEFHQPMTLIYQFCDNEMSSFYIDVCKDRLYADSSSAPSRKAIRTVMWYCLKTLTQLMSPVLSFTAEEIWQEIRKIDDTVEESVLLADWPSEIATEKFAEIEEKWERILQARSAIQRGLEKSRTAGVIGHPLDAELQVALGDKFRSLDLSDAMWQEILIVSSCKIVESLPDSEDKYTDEATGIEMLVAKSEAEKCPRCWRHASEVGHDGQEVCHRCKAVLAELGH